MAYVRVNSVVHCFWMRLFRPDKKVYLTLVCRKPREYPTYSPFPTSSSFPSAAIAYPEFTRPPSYPSRSRFVMGDHCVYYLRRRKKVGRKSPGFRWLRPVIKSPSTWCQPAKQAPQTPRSHRARRAFQTNAKRPSRTPELHWAAVATIILLLLSLLFYTASLPSPPQCYGNKHCPFRHCEYDTSTLTYWW